jgi:hypothetical protein
MQPAESTKPYIYYEQIINGLVSVPKKIQDYLGEAILVRNEKQRIEMEKQKEEAEAKKRLSLVEEENPQVEESSSGNNNSLFKLPLFGWFSSNSPQADKPATDPESSSEKSADKDPSSEDVERSAEKDPSSEDVERSAEKDPSSEDVEKSADQSLSSEKEPSSEASSSLGQKTLEKCDIRKWNSKLE